jgi:predicted transcriptional regulator
MVQRRSKVQIVYDLLIAAKQKGKIKPTHLLYKGNLSHIRLKEYIDELIQKKLLSKISEDNHVYYKITEQGVKFISDIEKMKEITEAFGL